MSDSLDCNRPALGRLSAAHPADAWDPLHTDAGVPGTYWTTANVGEAMPGVQTPLSWTTWKDKLDHGLKEAGYALGVLSRRERSGLPGPLVAAFFGRSAVSVNFFALLGDRTPGASTEKIVTTYFGSVPDGLAIRTTRRRYPVIAIRMPIAILMVGRRVRRFAAEQDRWWSDRIAQVPGLDEQGLRRLLVEAVERHDRAVITQCVGTLVGVQPAYDALHALADRTDSGDFGVLSAVPGSPEMMVVADIWAASRGRLPVEVVVARHGFHGPNEGEVCSYVWREDDGPLRTMIAQYSNRDEDADPVALERQRRRERAKTEARVVAEVPWFARPAARAVLAFARRRIPLRGLAKRSMLQSLDVVRAASRRLGTLLAEQGILADSGDVGQLTVDELMVDVPDDVRDLVAQRQVRMAEYRSFDVPSTWSATPEPCARNPGTDRRADVLVSGLGVSRGVVEGHACVLTDPDFTEVGADQILIAPHTDPSWSSIMFLSAGLVVDIGGAMSHAAVVARELEIPCVVDTGNGSRLIETGDLVRVDGEAGTVEILRRDAT